MGFWEEFNLTQKITAAWVGFWVRRVKPGSKYRYTFFMTAADLARSQDVLQAGRQDVTHVFSDSTLQGFALDRKLQSMASEDGWHGYREACRLPPSLITSNDGGSGGTKARGNGETSL